MKFDLGDGTALAPFTEDIDKPAVFKINHSSSVREKNVKLELDYREFDSNVSTFRNVCRCRCTSVTGFKINRRVVVTVGVCASKMEPTIKS